MRRRAPKPRTRPCAPTDQIISVWSVGSGWAIKAIYIVTWWWVILCKAHRVARKVLGALCTKYLSTSSLLLYTKHSKRCGAAAYNIDIIFMYLQRQQHWVWAAGLAAAAVEIWPERSSLLCDSRFPCIFYLFICLYIRNAAIHSVSASFCCTLCTRTVTDRHHHHPSTAVMVIIWRGCLLFQKFNRRGRSVIVVFAAAAEVRSTIRLLGCSSRHIAPSSWPSSVCSHRFTNSVNEPPARQCVYDDDDATPPSRLVLSYSRVLYLVRAASIPLHSFIRELWSEEVVRGGAAEAPVVFIGIFRS